MLGRWSGAIDTDVYFHMLFLEHVEIRTQT